MKWQNSVPCSDKAPVGEPFALKCLKAECEVFFHDSVWIGGVSRTEHPKCERNREVSWIMKLSWNYLYVCWGKGHMGPHVSPGSGHNWLKKIGTFLNASSHLLGVVRSSVVTSSLTIYLLWIMQHNVYFTLGEIKNKTFLCWKWKIFFTKRWVKISTFLCLIVRPSVC